MQKKLIKAYPFFEKVEKLAVFLLIETDHELSPRYNKMFYKKKYFKRNVIMCKLLKHVKKSIIPELLKLAIISTL